MGPCCVEGCEITSEETYYFEFPTSRLLRRKWLELIPIPGKLPLGTVVCSRHFSTDDYESVRGKVRLKGKVVPSLFLAQKQTPPSEIAPTEIAPSEISPSEIPSSKIPSSEIPPSEIPSSEIQSSEILPSEIPLPTSPPPTKAPLSPKSPPKSPKSPLSPRTPPAKVVDTGGDSTTVSVPSPVDAEKMIDDIQNRLTGSVQKLMKTQNGMSWDVSKIPTPASAPVIPPLDQKDDIEDMITNYHIKNKVRNPALLADLLPMPGFLAPGHTVPGLLAPGHTVPGLGAAGHTVPGLVAPGHTVPGLVAGSGQTVPVEFEVPETETIEIDDVKEADPVFIEVSVDKDANATGAGSQDCLMLLESVQVDVDPSTLLLAHDASYYRDEEWKASKKDDPISLLTSSDEDDVILQEPHIDTVEVSDETDEDDMPLVKLVKKKPEPGKKKLLKKKSRLKKTKEPNVEKIVWGMYDFYCVQCHFATKNAKEYNEHISEHSTILHVCPICSYTSASKSMFARHSRIHKVEKKFKCHLCDYRARHKMSLIYHLKKHNCDINSIKDFKCKRCGFKSDNKLQVLEHLSSCRDCDKKHVCDKCDYKTKKKSDLKRHRERIHPRVCDPSDPKDIEIVE